MYYKQPARNWHEALPLGNGRIEAMVFGGTKIEKIALNEESLWAGYPHKTQEKMPIDCWKKVEEFTREKRYSDATKLAEEMLGKSTDTQMYVPFGNLFLK